jgi:hypothetical protein
LPQFSTAIAAMGGKNWRGADLRLASGEQAGLLDKLKIGGYGTLRSLVPLMSQTQQALERGTPYDDATIVDAIFDPKVKPGSERELNDALEKLVNPFMRTPKGGRPESAGAPPKPGFGATKRRKAKPAWGGSTGGTTTGARWGG